MRVLRLQHVHEPPHGAGSVRRRLPRIAGGGDSPQPPRPPRPGQAPRHGVLRRRHAHDARPRPAGRGPGSPRLGLRAARRGADAGFTRVSFGMQSAVESVLAALDRRHTPGQVERAVAWARQAGLDVSVDLIYGAPGETMGQWRRSVDAALALEPDHVSAYALTVEPGTKMGAQAARGRIRLPDPDELADKYEAADEALTASGYRWYEISNWARPGRECRHNAVYWRSGNWWGYGPGAHSHINGTRFWNVKHPLAYARRIGAGQSPAAARETLTASERRRDRGAAGRGPARRPVRRRRPRRSGQGRRRQARAHAEGPAARRLGHPRPMGVAGPAGSCAGARRRRGSPLRRPPGSSPGPRPTSGTGRRSSPRPRG